MKSTIFFYLFFLIFLVTAVNAHSYISPGKYEVRYIPNEVKTFEFQFGGTGDYSYNVISSLAEVEVIDEIKEKDKTTIQVRVVFPSEIKTPGKIKLVRVIVEQDVEGSDGFGSQTRVISSIYAIVPYNGIYLENSLKVPNINVNETLNLEVISENLGNKDAKDVNVKVNILENNEIIKVIPFETKDVLGEKKVSFKNSWDSTGYSNGKYKAQAILSYSENEDKITKEFEIGSLNIEIINVTSELSSNGVNPFEIEVRNGWNGKLINVYGILELEDKQYQTVSSDLNPLAIGKLKGFADLRDMLPGNYNAKVKVDFGSKNAIKEFNIKVIESKEWYTGTLVIPAVIILIILNVIYLFIKRKHEHKKDEKKKKRKK